MPRGLLRPRAAHGPPLAVPSATPSRASSVAEGTESQRQLRESLMKVPAPASVLPSDRSDRSRASHRSASPSHSDRGRAVLLPRGKRRRTDVEPGEEAPQVTKIRRSTRLAALEKTDIREGAELKRMSTLAGTEMVPITGAASLCVD